MSVFDFFIGREKSLCTILVIYKFVSDHSKDLYNLFKNENDFWSTKLRDFKHRRVY